MVKFVVQKKIRGEIMKTQKMPKSMTGHGLRQVDLLNYLLNNLQQFNLKPTSKLVLMYLAGCYNPKHADVFPKQKTIADKMGISEASVIRAIQELHKEGLIISERKYTNRYKFTSRILNLGAMDEDLPQSNNMQVGNSQNETLETCNLQPACIEQEKEQEKEQTNSIEFEGFKILKNYAEQKGAKNITAYIKALKANGSADRIIKQEKEKQAIESYHAKRVEETQNWIKQNTSLTGVNPKECAKLQEVLKAMRM